MSAVLNLNSQSDNDYGTTCSWMYFYPGNVKAWYQTVAAWTKVQTSCQNYYIYLCIFIIVYLFVMYVNICTFLYFPELWGAPIGAHTYGQMDRRTDRASVEVANSRLKIQSLAYPTCYMNILWTFYPFTKLFWKNAFNNCAKL